MKPEQEYRLYNRFSNSITTKNGVEITHRYNDEIEMVIFQVKNNGQPYTREAIDGFIKESLHEFYVMLGKNFHYEKGLFKDYGIECEEIFLGKLGTETRRELEKITQISFRPFNRDLGRITLNVKHNKFRYEVDNDLIILRNYVELELTPEQIWKFTEEELVELYLDFTGDDPNEESDTIYSNIDEIISKYESFCDQDYMYNRTETRFIMS